MDAATPKAEDSMIVLDLGKKKRKAIRQLRKGRGKLTEKLHDAIEELKADKTLEPSGRVVVVIVREKRKKRAFSMW